MPNQTGANGPVGHTSAPSKAAQSGQKAFSAAAKKDPSLLPLAFIFVAGFTAAGYMMTNKWGNASRAETQFAPTSNPWSSGSTSESQLYKYRYANRKGKIESSQPATTYETVPVTGDISRLRAFSQPHHTTDKP